MTDVADQQFTLSEQDATRLRDALRREVEARTRHELTQLRARIDFLEASTERRAVFESLADAHGFDATDVFEFDFQLRTLTMKKGQ